MSAVVITRQNRVTNVLREMGRRGAMVIATGMKAKGDVLIKRVSNIKFSLTKFQGFFDLRNFMYGLY